MLQRIGAWFAKRWQPIRPGPEAGRGAFVGLVAAAASCAFIGGLYLRSGFGRIFDFAFAFLFAGITIPLAALLIALIFWITRQFTPLRAGLVIACCAFVSLIWGPPELGLALGVTIAVLEGLLGASLATLFSGSFSGIPRSRKVITILFLVASMAGNGYLLWLFAADGSGDGLAKWKPSAQSMPAKLNAPNPSDRGPFAVKTLIYGAGTDIRRPEYGPNVPLKTRTVDASEFFKDFGGWKHWARKTYWGFDMDKLPLNGRVWYPEGQGPFPLALIVHGNHEMSEFSDPGYAYLGELLASRGIILASIDENFLNSGLFHDPPKQQAVRGWMLLEHLKLWREWTQKAGSPFYGKVDLSRIALIGHSRGGEAVATAASFNRMKYDPENANIKFDYGFAIRSLVAIAPVDGQYRPAGQHRWVEDVNYLTLQGGHDADVSSFMGSRQWDFARYTKPGDFFKAEIYAYRANHGQFNTVWGRKDAGGPMGWLLNLKPLLSGEDQRRISKTYISAFLEATLKDRREYVPLFQDWRTGRDWLPETIYLNRYQDARYVPVAAFQEDPDLTTTTVPGGHIDASNLSLWHEGRIPWRSKDRDYNGVFLGWNRAKDAAVPEYHVSLPEGLAARSSTLELSVAAMDQDAPLLGKKKDDKKKDQHVQDRESPDFTIELVSKDGAIQRAPVSRFVQIPPPLKETFTVLGPLESQAYERDWEPVFQTIRAPFRRFDSGSGAQFDPAELSEIRLKFDRTTSYVICISGIGFGSE